MGLQDYRGGLWEMIFDRYVAHEFISMTHRKIALAGKSAVIFLVGKAKRTFQILPRNVVKRISNKLIFFT